MTASVTGLRSLRPVILCLLAAVGACAQAGRDWEITTGFMLQLGHCF